MTLPRFEQYIDGQFEPGGATFESVDPSTSEPWAVMPEAGPEDVDRAVRAAHRALSDPAWAGLTASRRGRLLCRLADLVEAAAPRIAELETRDTGKIIRETSAQIAYVADYYRYFAGMADKVEGVTLPIDKPDMDVSVVREPIGVVAAIVPWNSQLFLSAVKIAPALAAGCTVVVKASGDGPAPLLELARLIHEAGFPPGVVNVLTGARGGVGEALTGHPLVSRVAFTGGPATARHVVRNTANNLAVTTLELGGKSPVIVCDDANLDGAANAVVAGIFAASGQSCVAGSRLLVQEGVREALLDRLVAKAKAIRIGDPQDRATEMGPLATRRQLDHIRQVIAASVDAGAELLAGGGQPAGLDRGFYIEPTILSGAPALPCFREELFGPVLSVVPFSDEEDAVRLANDSDYAFAAGIFTENLGRAHRLSRRVNAGVVWVNTYRAVSPMAPFGGSGLSGMGREAGADSIRDYTRARTIWVNRSTAPMADPFVMR